jgi:hypothetical protein
MPKKLTPAEHALACFLTHEGSTGFIGNDIRALMVGLMQMADGCGVNIDRLVTRAMAMHAETKS